MKKFFLSVKRFFVFLTTRRASSVSQTGLKASTAGLGAVIVKNTRSIYESIIDHLDSQGRLPSDFIWQPEEVQNENFRMAPGAMDGIMLYHQAISSSDEDIHNLLELISKAGRDNENDALIEFLKKHSTLTIVDGLMTNIIQNINTYDPQSLINAARQWASAGRDVELVKLGIAILGVFDIEENKDLRNTIMTLGKYDEFTLYALVAMSNWQNGNQNTWELARLLNESGWGIVHAIERLRPENEKIREWIITNGCKGMLAELYLGPTCAINGDLLGYLKQNEISEAVFNGAGLILSSILSDDGPIDGLRAYEDADEAMLLYLKHAVEHCRTLEHFVIATKVKKKLVGTQDGRALNKDQLAALDYYQKSTKNRDWPKLVLNTITFVKDSELHFASQAADFLRLDISEPVFNLIREQPLSHNGLLAHLFKDKIIAEKTAAFYENYLPLDKIGVYGPEEFAADENLALRVCFQIILQHLADYPKIGLLLLKTAFMSPLGGNRRAAYIVLHKWLTTDDKLLVADIDPELLPLIQKAFEEESDQNFKAQMESLIDEKSLSR